MESPTTKKLKKEVTKAYKDSFRTRLEEELKNNTTEGVTWMVALHRELIIRLCKYVKKRPDVQDEIAEACDPVIFKQLLETGHYGVNDLSILIEYVYMWLKKFCAPVRDETIASSLSKLQGLLRDDKVMLYEVVSAFVVEVHEVMDLMDKDADTKLVNDFKEAVKKFVKK